MALQNGPIVTIQVNGKPEEDIDRTRPDLRKIEEPLKQKIRIRAASPLETKSLGEIDKL
jgi:hypothetical protein